MAINSNHVTGFAVGLGVAAVGFDAGGMSLEDLVREKERLEDLIAEREIAGEAGEKE